MKEIKNALLPSLPVHVSSQRDQNERELSSPSVFLGHNSMRRVKQFFEKGKKASIFDPESARKSIRPLSPTLISINYLKKQDPFYRKILNSGENELLECSIHIMKKPPKDRMLSEIQILRKYTENLFFFKKLIEKHGLEYHHRCVSVLKYQFYPKGSHVIEYGSMGLFFFIIMQGTVGVMTPCSPFLMKRKNSFDNIKLFDKAFVNREARPLKGDIPKTNEITEALNAFVEVSSLGPGAAFGEYSLISNRPAQASIVCKEDCSFAVLEKSNFNSILRESQKMNWVANVELLRKMPIFTLFSENQIHSLFVSLVERHYRKKYIIFNQKDESDEVFFVKDGEFLIFKELSDEGKFPKATANSRISKPPRTFINLSIICRGDFVGFEDYFLGQKRNFGLRCISMEGGKLFSMKNEANY